MSVYATRSRIAICVRQPDVAVLDRDRRRRFLVEEHPQRLHSAASALELALHATEVRTDRSVPGLNVRRFDDAAYIVEWHPELPEPPDHLRLRHLRDVVAPVARVRVDRRRRQQSNFVVMVQRLHAQERHPREVADAQQVLITRTMKPSVAGESSPAPHKSPRAEVHRRDESLSPRTSSDALSLDLDKARRTY